MQEEFVSKWLRSLCNTTNCWLQGQTDLGQRLGETMYPPSWLPALSCNPLSPTKMGWPLKSLNNSDNSTKSWTFWRESVWIPSGLTGNSLLLLSCPLGLMFIIMKKLHGRFLLLLITLFELERGKKKKTCLFDRITNWSIITKKNTIIYLQIGIFSKISCH